MADDAFHQLTKVDARLIRALIAAGMKQHDIAAVFGTNSGRIAEIATGERYANEPAALLDDFANVEALLMRFKAATNYRLEEVKRAVDAAKKGQSANV